MDAFVIASGVASIIGMVFAILAFIQAKRASRAAAEARDKVVLRTLADELEVSCIHAEQLKDLLIHDRVEEAVLRISELTSTLSEFPNRRSPYLNVDHANALLTAREQLQSIADVVHQNGEELAHLKGDLVKTAHRVTISLREVLGAVKGGIEYGEDR